MKLDVKRVGFLSDLHRIDPRHNVSDAKVDRLVYHVNAANLDMVVLMGDHGASGTVEELNAAKKVYERFDVEEVVDLPGNHDVNFQGIGLERVNYANYLNYASDVNTVDVETFPYLIELEEAYIIGLNTVKEGVPLARGAIGGVQLERIDRLINALKFEGKPIILAGHHCPSADGRGLSWTRALSDRRELESVLEAHDVNVYGVFGHVHTWREWSGVLGFRELRGTPMMVDGFWVAEFFNGGVSWERIKI